jgi:hypothetical protein
MPWFHAVSLSMAPLAAMSRVPPTASTCGQDAGKSTWFLPSFMPLLEPLSPAAATTVMPIMPASRATSSKFSIDCGVQLTSALPQPMQITLGLLSWS